MERSFTDQSTLQEDERMALSFMDAHTCGTRSKTNALTHTIQCAKTYWLTTTTQSNFKPDAHHPSLCNLVDRHSFTP